MTYNLKKYARAVALGLLVASMILSFKGFEFNFQNTTGIWQFIFYAIGILLTLSVTVLQLVFSTDWKNLNATLKLFGFLSYIYSIWSNYSGLKPFVSMGLNPQDTEIAAIMVGLFLDCVPEPLLAWSMGESLNGDVIGNLLKMLGGIVGFGDNGGGQRRHTQSSSNQTRQHENNEDRTRRHESLRNPQPRPSSSFQSALEDLRSLGENETPEPVFRAK